MPCKNHPERPAVAYYGTDVIANGTVTFKPAFGLCQECAAEHRKHNLVIERT